MTRRRFAVLGTAFLAGSVISSLTGSLTALALSAVLTAAALVSGYFRHKGAAFVLAALAASFLVYGIYSLAVIEPCASLDKQTLDMKAEVTEVRRVSDKLSYVTVRPEDGSFLRFCFPVYEQQLSEGDIVSSRFYFYSQEERDFYSYSKGIFIGAKAVSDVTVTGHKDSITAPVKAYSAYLRGIVADRLETGDAGLISAMFFGDRSGLDPFDAEYIRRAGLSHMVSVSGMHLSLIINMLLLLPGLIPYGRSPRVRFAAVTLLCAVFTVFFGFKISVIRSAVMMLVYCGAGLFDRETDTLNSLGFAVFVILLASPCACMDTGLWFSALGTLGVGCLAPALIKKLTDKGIYPAKLTEMLISGICASLCTIPVSILCCGGFSPLSAAATVAVYPFFFLAMIGMLFFMFSGGAFTFVLVPVGALSAVMRYMISGFASLPGSFVCADAPAFAALAAILAVYIFVSRRFGKTAFGYSVIVSLAVFAGFVLAEQARLSSQTRITVTAGGSSQLVTVSHRGRTYAIAHGDSGRLLSYALSGLTYAGTAEYDCLTYLGGENDGEDLRKLYSLAGNTAGSYSCGDLSAAGENGAAALTVGGLTLVMNDVRQGSEGADINVLYGYDREARQLPDGINIFCDRRYTGEGYNAYYSDVTVIIYGEGFRVTGGSRN